MLDKIIEFTDQAHGEQTRKYTPDRYIVHPVRVMEICREYTDDMAVLAAALLHDVLEDTPTTAQELKKFLIPLMGEAMSIRTVDLVIELTDVYIKKDYPHWNRRKRKQMEKERMEKTSPTAQTIKYADILDNCMEIVKHDPSFARVFLSECKGLLKSMTKGNPVLHERALSVIEANLEELKKRNSKKER